MGFFCVWEDLNLLNAYYGWWDVKWYSHMKTMLGSQISYISKPPCGDTMVGLEDKEIKIKTTPRYNCIPTIGAKVKKVEITKLARMWSNHNSCAVLMGVHAGIATLEN